MPCAAPVTIAAVPSNRAIGSSLYFAPRLGKRHPALAADEEKIAPLEEFDRPLGAAPHIGAARRRMALAGSDGSSAFRAVSAPQTGSLAASISPSCANTEA